MPFKKLSPQDKQEIWINADRGVDHKLLAQQYRASPKTIDKIASATSWREFYPETVPDPFKPNRL